MNILKLTEIKLRKRIRVNMWSAFSVWHSVILSSVVILLLKIQLS